MPSEYSNCPDCGLPFDKEDIYQFFLNDYLSSGIPPYSKSLEELYEISKIYPNQFDMFIETAHGMNKVQLAALESAYMYGWRANNPKCFRAEIGIEVRAEKKGDWGYDGIALWQCPSCKYTWKRFDAVPDHILEKYVKNRELHKKEFKESSNL